MNRLLYLLQVLLGVGAGIWLVVTGCTIQPECRTDRDCVQTRGPEFLCFELICRRQSVVLEPSTDSGPDTKPESKPDPDTKLQEEPTTQDESTREQTPEPVQETTVELPPDAGKLPVGAPCERSLLASPADRCAPGLVCARFDSSSAYCLQDCSQSSGICANNTDGRTTCMHVAWSQGKTPQRVMVCAKVAQQGQPCDPQQSLFCERKQGSEHLVCRSGKCVKGKLCTTEGCSCGVQATPPVACDITKQLICDHSSNQCARGVRAYEGEACSAVGGTKRYCDVDHLCVTYGGGSNPDICLKLCDVNQPQSSCSHRSPKSFKCISIGGGRGGCVQDNCGKQADCAFQEYPHYCLVQTSPSRTTTCSPLPLPGERGYAETCRANDTTKGCAHPFLCIASFCTIQCSSDNDCRALGPKGGCFLRDNTTGVLYCGFRCAEGCPTGMQCQQGQNFCVGTPP